MEGYGEPRKVAHLIAEGLILVGSFVFPAAIAVGILLFPGDFQVSGPFALGAIIAALLPAAWVVGLWPDMKAGMLEAFPVRIEGGVVIFPTSPFSRRTHLRRDEVSKVLAEVDPGGSLTYLVVVDRRGDLRARPYNKSPDRQNVYVDTVSALRQELAVVDLASESRAASRRKPPRAIFSYLIALSAPVLVLAASLSMSPSLAGGGFLFPLSATAVVALAISLPSLRRIERWRYQVLVGSRWKGPGV